MSRALENNPHIPPELKDPKNWPEALRQEWGYDEGFTAAQRHLDRLARGFRKHRAGIDSFGPDFVLIWGDDQY